jgi:polyphosphate kinase 2
MADTLDAAKKKKTGKDKASRKKSGSKAEKSDGASSKRLSRQTYEAALEPLELELNRMARWVQQTRRRVVVIFEGRDTAGKGGVISAINAPLNPRQVHVVALPKPSEAERTQWYFQRYVEHLPAAGEIVLFDRSWYNRAGVEKVMGFCSDAEYRRFLQQAPAFEKLLVDDGIVLLKYWLTVDQAQQEARFQERLDDPLKRWKLSPIDLQSREHYREYGKARDAMLKATHTRHAPWTLVDFNDQRLGRLTLIRHMLDKVPEVEVPQETVVFPELTHAPLTESFGGPVKPIRPFKIAS